MSTLKTHQDAGTSDPRYAAGDKNTQHPDWLRSDAGW